MQLQLYAVHKRYTAKVVLWFSSFKKVWNYIIWKKTAATKKKDKNPSSNRQKNMPN